MSVQERIKLAEKSYEYKSVTINCYAYGWFIYYTDRNMVYPMKQRVNFATSEEAEEFIDTHLV